MTSTITTAETLLDPSATLSGGSWFAVLAKSGYEGVTLPVAVEVAGEKLVAWKSPITSEWSVMHDECPHRLAPLSQGRVDPLTGCIECPYHGQQFDSTGACTLIPQSNSAVIPPEASGISLRVHHTGDLLWAFLPLPNGQASNYPALPSEVFPIFMDTTSVLSRDLPYSFDFLIENFMDPAHIPFAHHSLQGSRSDGSPIPMKIITSMDDPSKVEVEYTDMIKKKERNGVVSFVAPCYYHFRLRNELTKEYSQNLNVVVVPIAPGSCRIFLDVPALRKFRKKFPVWMSHMLSNKFLDSDLWIHDQERSQRHSINSFIPTSKKRKQGEAVSGDGIAPSIIGDRYVMTTQSDTGTRVWRKWWMKHMAESPIFGELKVPPPYFSREEQLDRYESHAKYCSSCRGALTNADTVKKVSPFISVFLAAIAPNKISKVLGVAVGFLANIAAERVRRGILGIDKDGVYSAAQYPPKKPKK